MFSIGTSNPTSGYAWLVQKASKDHLVPGPNNEMESISWNGQKKQIIAAKESYSKIVGGLINHLLSVGRDEQAQTLFGSTLEAIPSGNFKGLNCLACLVAIEKKLPAMSHPHISKEIAESLRPHLLSGSVERTTRVLQLVVEDLTARHVGNDQEKIRQILEEAAAAHSSDEKTVAVEEAKNVETKGASGGVNHRGAEFVVNAEMFPTRPGTADYKRRAEEGRKYFASTKHLDAAIDFVTSRVKFPYTFVLKHVTAEELAKAYASSPEGTKPDNAPFGLLHRLSVLFLNTTEPENESVANAAMNYALRASWERAVVENNTQQTEQQEILARMNLSRAGELVK